MANEHIIFMDIVQGSPPLRPAQKQQALPIFQCSQPLFRVPQLWNMFEGFKC